MHSLRKIDAPIQNSADVDTHSRTGSNRSMSVHVKKLEAPKFSGKIREFPTFVKDYRHYMEPAYGDDAYALRNCLSEKALEIIIGVGDDYEKIWKRVPTVFGDPEKIVDSILMELKSLKEEDQTNFNDNSNRTLLVRPTEIKP